MSSSVFSVPLLSLTLTLNLSPPAADSLNLNVALPSAAIVAVTDSVATSASSFVVLS